MPDGDTAAGGSDRSNGHDRSERDGPSTEQGDERISGHKRKATDAAQPSDIGSTSMTHDQQMHASSFSKFGWDIGDDESMSVMAVAVQGVYAAQAAGVGGEAKGFSG